MTSLIMQCIPIMNIVEMAPLAARMLALKDAQIMEKTCVLPDGREGGFGMAGELPKEMTLLQCAEYVKDVFQIPDVKIFGNPETVLNRAAVLPGSGKSMTADALRNGAEVYITGDFGHHDGIDAVDQGLNVIDAGHNTMFRLEMPKNCEITFCISRQAAQSLGQNGQYIYYDQDMNNVSVYFSMEISIHPIICPDVSRCF